MKIRGYRIELGEIETVLEHHPEVARAVVIVRTDVADQQRLVAYVVPRDGKSPPVESLRAHLGQKLPDYMIPSAFM